VSQSILEEVRQRNARLLVMGAYGHSTAREFLLGSITKAILKEIPVPVFLCH
jgi:nucleotide-binding universal stress UspA family protein